MDGSIKLTVFFDDPFWAAVYERTEDGKLQAARVVFGAEPKDSDVYDFFLKNWTRLRFSPRVTAGRQEKTKVNPKRMQRQIQRQVADSGAGTKAQQALKLLQEQGKQKRKEKNRAMKEAEEQRKFELRQQKRKEKHRGR
ncbi:YjdF family protein [Caproicibacter sp.]|uniref:YjdF family protein n=1 Tax=Caproicibacter sp. TaxID=2814884 RepID=UPI00398933BD